MRTTELPRTSVLAKLKVAASKLSNLKSFIIFNLAAVIGFILGTASFAAAMYVFPATTTFSFAGSIYELANSTFAWLFANAIGGISHFSANYIMQRQTKEKIVRNFIVFNATGIAGFLIATALFAAALVFVKEPNASWLVGTAAGTFSHYVLNEKAMKLKFRQTKALRFQ